MADAVFVFQEQKQQEEAGAAKDDPLELKPWNKQAESCEDDTEVNSQTNRSPGLWLPSQPPLLESV